ncbi:MAG TPA: cytochrome c [Candidatus Saccharimonadales bacterium]|nr:cytochrome c [Candidatus Saccharimonadales bacterium]
MKRCPPMLAALTLLAILLAGCSGNMTNDSRLKPLEGSKFFANGSSARPLPAHVIPRGELREDQALYEGKNGTNLVNSFPFSITLAVLERGQERFDVYCAVCHGRDGGGNGMIVQRGFPPPPSFHIDRLQQAPVGHLFDVITHGYGIMYPYASRVEVEDRWAIAAYIRALQYSHQVQLRDLPAAERAKLENQQP